jgi:hypothetical protein
LDFETLDLFLFCFLILKEIKIGSENIEIEDLFIFIEMSNQSNWINGDELKTLEFIKQVEI